MKKAFFILSFFFLFFAVQPAWAQEKINLYFFYGDGCPHCAKEEKFLNQLEAENKNIKIYRYETWNNRGNADLLAQIAEGLGVRVSGVPFLVIGDKTVSGYYSAETTGKKIQTIIEDYEIYGCSDVVAPFLKSQPGSCVHGCDQGDGECMHDCGCSVDTVAPKDQKIPETIQVPLLGEIKTKNISLPLLTFIIAGIDGFNPCAMWVLLFLINLLLGMSDKRRMRILGTAFIISSGAVYFLFLSAWLNLFMFLGFVLWIRIAISLVALVSGVYHINDWRQHRNAGCKVVGTEKRKRIFARLREIALAQKFWLAFLGIILLAASVNLVELVCSAGLPAVYTQVLALSDLPAWQYYSYLFLYILVFMADDLAVFFIAMKTLEIKATDSVFSRYSGLVGGVIMVIIGLLLMLKPGWLMFG